MYMCVCLTIPNNRLQQHKHHTIFRLLQYIISTCIFSLYTIFFDTRIYLCIQRLLNKSCLFVISFAFNFFSSFFIWCFDNSVCAQQQHKFIIAAHTYRRKKRETHLFQNIQLQLYAIFRFSFADIQLTDRSSVICNFKYAIFIAISV